LKTVIVCFLWAICYWACNSSSGEDKTQEDSLQYYPPTPRGLTREQFRKYYRDVSRYFDSALIRRGFNGGIIVAKDGNVIYEKYAGFSDLRTKDSLTDSTSIHIASTSKTFMGIAVLRLVQENRLSLDDSLTKFFPGFPYPGITVKMLLNHRSGLPNYLYFMDKSNWDKKKYARNEDVLQYMYTDVPKRSFSPNTHFSYSNTNFILLAMIIEKVTGRTYPEHMKHTFFDPMGMRHTYVFTISDTLTATPSFNYNGNYWAYDFLDATYGDKNIYSTPRDLLIWDQALYTEQIISKALLDSAFTPYSNERRSIHNYGLGWRLQILPNGKKIIYHFGKWHGFNSAFTRLTDERATIIILGNKFNRAIYNSAHHSYDLFGKYWDRNGGSEDEDEDNSEAAKTPEPSTKK
jgi:CubicO group peptidase (beta-lactamase class C family)